MKVKYIALALMVISLFVIAGCGNNQADYGEESVYNGEMPEDIQEQMDAQAEDEMEVESSSTMKKCTSKAGAPVEFLYYITDDMIYEKVTVDNGGYNEKIASKTQTCIKNLDTERMGVEWNCFDSDVSTFNQMKEGVDQQTTGMMAEVMGVKCSTVDFDASVFSTN